MSKNSYAQHVKLKISKFEEKYSKKVIDHSEAVGKIVKQEELTISDNVEDTDNQFKKSSEELSELHTNNCTLHVHDYIFNKIQNSNSSLSHSLPSSIINAPNKVSFESVEDSKVSKQFENIGFVSSFSNEPSFTQAIYLKNAKKSIDLIKPYATQFDYDYDQFSILDTSNKSIDRPSYNNSQPIQKTSDGSDNNDSITSAFNSKMSSIEEISSISENKGNSSNDVSDIIGVISKPIKSISGMPKNHETEITRPNSNLQQAELKTFSEGLKTISRNTTKKSNSSPKSCSRDISVASNISSKSRPNNSDTKSAVLFTKPNLTNNNAVVDTENIKLNKHVLKKNLSVYKKKQCILPMEKLNTNTNAKTFQDRPSYQHNLSLNHCLKQTTLKSCKLIRHIETNRHEFEELVQKALISSSLNVQHNLFYSENGTGHNCDQVMQQLLRNQIKMTRHFIESHHQMYLLCCQAVKVLSEKYVSNNEHAFQ